MIAKSGPILRLPLLRKSQKYVTCAGPERKKYSCEANAE